MEHPLPPGIFVEMKPSPDEFDDDDIMDDPDVTCLTHLARRVKMTRTNHSQVGQFRVHMFERVE